MMRVFFSFFLLFTMFNILTSLKSKRDRKLSYKMSAAESFPPIVSQSASEFSSARPPKFLESCTWDLSDVHVTQRVDEQKKLLHTEVYTNSWALPIILKLPDKLRRPIAKMGIRTYSASGEMMDNIISNIYGEDTSNKAPSLQPTSSTLQDPPYSRRSVIDASYIRSRSYHPSAIPPPQPSTPRKFHSVALFVYMWVNPKFRGQSYGDYLLSLAMDMCRERGDEYMLLVHDDNGSGRLVKHYVNRGFVPIFNFIEKGMIYKL